jgi:hypothetical protein
VLRGLLPERDHRSLSFASLSPDDRAVIDQLVVAGRSPDDAAAALGTSVDDVHARFVRALRSLAGLPRSSPSEVALGSYLLWDGPVAERDLLAHELWTQDVDPLETDLLIRTLQRLRRDTSAVQSLTAAGV